MADMKQILRRMDFTSLRLFVVICQENSIARAAEREFIAASAVSRRLAELETLVGLPLVQRHTRGVSLTPAGAMVLRHAQQILAGVEAMSAELSRVYAGVNGHVRVVANPSAIVQFLPEDISAFQRLYPEVAIDLEEQHSPDVLRLVRDRDADFGVCNRIAGMDDLEWQPYRRDRLAVVLPASHPKADAQRLRLADIVDETFVGMREPSALTHMLAVRADALERKLSVKFRVGSLDVLCRMAHVGLGIAIVPQKVAELYIKALDLVLRPLDEPWAQREICVVYPREEQLSATAAALARFLGQGR